jgi:AcrR family transcriptional regulator
MAFGKRGRPPEDKIARQREIYDAVSPLILQVGARRLSMRQAAQVANISIGGLYHYFPTKRDLVLHGLRPEAIVRYCEEFHAQYGHLAYVDPQAYVNEGVEVVVRHIELCRPAVHAALELGTESFWEVIDNLLTSTALDFQGSVRQLLPHVKDEEVQQVGRAIRRSMCAALLDKNISPDEFREELRMLFSGFFARIGRARRALAEAPVGTGAAIS